MFDPNDKRQVDQRAKRERLDGARAADDVLVVMRTPEGRRFVHGLLGLTGLRESAWRSGGADAARQQDFQLGRQSVGLDLLQNIELHAGAETELMMSEARAAAAERRAIEQAEEAEAEGEQQERTDG